MCRLSCRKGHRSGNELFSCIGGSVRKAIGL